MWELRQAPQTPSLAGGKETGLPVSRQLGQKMNLSLKFMDINLPLHLSIRPSAELRRGQPLGSRGVWESWLRDPNT